MSRKPKIVVPGLNRGAGIPPGFLLGRDRNAGHGPAQLLDLIDVVKLGVQTVAGSSQGDVKTASTAHSETTSLSTSISTSLSQISSSLSGAISSVSSLSTAVSSVDSGQTTSLSQISSSLSGAISSTTSLSAAVSGNDSAVLSTAESYTDAAVAAAASGGGTGTSGTGVIAGLGVSYVSGLTFAMTAGSANINGTTVTAVAQTTTLSAADATLSRIDVLYVDDTGTFGHITGTPATNPSQPTVDPTSQLYLAFALVPPTATSLPAFTTETIYDEGSGGEWTGSTSGTGFTVGSTNNPNSGTKDIEGTSVVAGAYVKLVDGSPSSFDGDGNLLLSIRSKATWNTKRSLILQWYRSSVAKGVPVTLKNGSFSFDSSNTSSYQALAIAKSSFSVPAGQTIDELRITAAGTGGTFGFYIDPIKLQTVTSGSGGSGGGGTTTGITQDQADARYEQLSNFVSSSTVFSTSISTNLSKINSLSTAVSTVISGSISTVNSRIDSLSTAGGGGGGGGPDPGQSTSLSQISSSLSGAISSTSSLSTAVSTVDANQSTSVSINLSKINSLSTAVSTVDSNESTSLSQISSSLSGGVSSTTSLSTAVSTVDANQSSSISANLSRINSLSTAVGGGGGGGAGLASIVQYKSFIGGPPTMTLDAAPSNGNLIMIQGTHWNGITAVDPAWEIVRNLTGVTTDGIIAVVKQVTATESASATITNPFTANSGGAGGMSLTVVEVSGALTVRSLGFDGFKEVTGTSQAMNVASGKNGTLFFGIAATTAANTAPSSITNATALSTCTGTTTSGSPRQITPFKVESVAAGTATTITPNYASSCRMYGCVYAFIPA